MNSVKPRAVISFKVLPSVRERFVQAFDATFVDEDRIRSDQALLEAARQGECLIVASTQRLDRNIVLALPRNVGIVGTYSVGTDHIDLAAATERALPVLNTPDVLTDAVAEVGLFLLIGAARRATESLALLRSEEWPGGTPTQLLGVQLTGRRLGILGMGRIGCAIALRARAFGMQVHYSNRHRLPGAKEVGAIFHDTLQSLLRVSDCLMLCCPASPETVGAIDKTALELLPHGAILVNVARGNVVKDEALLEALRSGQVRAAGLDVFDNEPKLDQRYFAMPNVFMTPHIGSSTLEAREQMAQVLIDGIKTYLSGGAPVNRVV